MIKSENELYRELLVIFKDYDEVWGRIVSAVNGFVKENGLVDGDMESIGGAAPYFVSDFVSDFVDRMCLNMCLNGAWVRDRLSGYQGFPASKTYKKSLAKKIRKALGYAY